MKSFENCWRIPLKGLVSVRGNTCLDYPKWRQQKSAGITEARDFQWPPRMQCTKNTTSEPQLNFVVFYLKTVFMWPVQGNVLNFVTLFINVDTNTCNIPGVNDHRPVSKRTLKLDPWYWVALHWENSSSNNASYQHHRYVREVGMDGVMMKWFWAEAQQSSAVLLFGRSRGVNTTVHVLYGVERQQCGGLYWGEASENVLCSIVGRNVESICRTIWWLVDISFIRRWLMEDIQSCFSNNLETITNFFYKNRIECFGKCEKLNWLNYFLFDNFFAQGHDRCIE